MAKGRVLSKEIAVSRQLWRMGHDHVLLWCLLIPHLDRDGRVSGEPAIVKGQFAPLAHWTVEQTESMLFDFAKLPDVQYYEDEHGERYLQFDKFADFQVGFQPGQKNYEREPKSRCPKPSECHAVQRTRSTDLPELRVVGDAEDPF
jgi:hypothetical protein